MNSKLETPNSKLATPPRHRMISRAAARLHRRRNLSRHWLASAGPRPVPGRSSAEPTNTPEQSDAHSGPDAPFPLTPALSLGERENRGQPNSGGGLVLGTNGRRCLPLPQGEGRGEGEQSVQSSTRFHSRDEQSILDPTTVHPCHPVLSPHAPRITFHVLALFVFFVSFVVSLPAAVITGNLQTTSGNPYATNALFAPLSTPLASGSSLIASTPTNVVAAADGSFSVVLKQGNYLVTIGGLRRDSVLISVPNDANTYNLNSLITNGMTFNFPYSPIYEQRSNKGQSDGYVGLTGTVLNPSGLTASNFSFQGTVNLGTAPDNYATVYVNQNSSLYVQPGGALTLAGDSTPRSEMFLHGTNAFVRFDEDAAINDSTAARVWKFNRFNVTSNNVATLGEATNIVKSLGIVPIGGIVAWHKTFANTPALPGQFVECNGQTLSDSASPYNGQVIPNLNGNNNFLRGNSTSGGTGGASTHTHTVNLSVNLATVSGDNNNANVPSPTTYTTASADHTPPYMNVVWIMRVK